MERTTVYLTKEQKQRLKEIADPRVNFSEHIRRAIDDYLEALEKRGETK